ncbi:hypothetical protein BDV28DRAFT_134782 [Aspergillus coremiiformis]|uniref:NADH dehydrogenase [ubiquinone] 1 alpha subcomplex assembly factor 3 n=1 Tax=Aspergillus coremiiformis TaxID=138285 RepID=A0A5N6Z4R5_9EURO|nr:hypothetical protein BDV28DRAFT_134782 [Aspergillus coremiiformis]
MNPPSTQLLRALRTSISTANRSNRLCANARSAYPISHIPPYVQSHRNQSNHARPVRMIPRAHTPKPTSHDRGPRSTENTQTDFATLNVLGNIPAPTTAIEACLDNGFHLDNGLKLTNGDGLLLIGGEAFSWRPWKATDGDLTTMVNQKGQFEVDEQAWGLLGLVWPRPDLLIIGMGASVFPLSPETRRQINSLGVRVEVLDTRNAAAQFNLLATERGVSEIAAAMVPIGWKGR